MIDCLGFYQVLFLNDKEEIIKMRINLFLAVFEAANLVRELRFPFTTPRGWKMRLQNEILASLNANSSAK